MPQYMELGARASDGWSPGRCVVGAQQVVGCKQWVEDREQPVVARDLLVDSAAPHQRVDALGRESLERVAATIRVQVRLQAFTEPRELILAEVVLNDGEAIRVSLAGGDDLNCPAR